MSYTQLMYHIVIGTRSHRPVIDQNYERELYSYILSFTKNKNGGCVKIQIHNLTTFNL